MNTQDIETIILTRSELYDRVWSTAMRNLAPDLGISDVGLKKLCKRFSIPTPPVGHWAKKEHGKKTVKPKLPTSERPAHFEIKFHPNTRKLQSHLNLINTSSAVPDKSSEKKIVVPELLSAPLPIVERTKNSLESAKPDDEGLVQPRAKKTLNIIVAPENIDRALRIMDTLLKAIEERGMPFELVHENETWVSATKINDEQICFGISEIVLREEREPTPHEKEEMKRWSWHQKDQFYKKVPTGHLCLAIHSGPSDGQRRRFSDTQRRNVENQLNGFITAMYRTAESIKVDRAQREQRQRELEESERKRHEFERQRVSKLQEIKEEEQRISDLMSNSKSWNTSQTLRCYICAVRGWASEENHSLDQAGLENWLKWATDQADRLDPLKESPTSILDEKSKWNRYY
tara:strand:+ start:22612 stop:23820 length:1209 start_codon:yes stop_codon:yes gene_type:complete